ncbi:transcription initiation factor tfiid subunit 10 [Ophiostoma piceae UAMH 11346]|uniref:Transcription initiation factor TFIID subunit 10 n=1 Tax=Ophiostoma piceae (strain UAMH 11346) TaxID=1262450 RepID=S3C3N9_OPHP1|nr:transcription initiation factor tfiid subunit 10 [Ophiostoma piceae UAMH 11346]
MATNTDQDGANGQPVTNGAGAAPAASGAAPGAPSAPSAAVAAAAALAAGRPEQSADAEADGPNMPPPAHGGLDARPVTTAKDISLKDFLNKMDDYAPIIPDAVTNYYMTKAGLPPPPQTDARLARLLALATQKFVADIAADAYQYSRVRASNSSSANPMGNLGVAGGAVGIPGAVGGAPAGGKDQKGNAALGVQRPGYGGGGQGSSQNRTVLTMEDLGMAVGEYGVNVKRGEFYR